MLYDVNRAENGDLSDGGTGPSGETPPPLVPCNPTDAISYDLDRLNEDRFRLTLAIAGFDLADIHVRIENGALRVSGNRQLTAPDGKRIHKGLSHSLDCRFLLLEPLSIADMELTNGLLVINLEGDGLEPCLSGRPALFADRARLLAMAA